MFLSSDGLDPDLVIFCLLYSGYHAWDTSIRLRLMGFRKIKVVKPLNEDMAVEQASEILGELIIYSVAAGTILWEYRRGVRNDQKKESVQNDRLKVLEMEIRDLGIQLEVQSGQMREMTRQIAGLNVPRMLPVRIKDKDTGTVLKVEKR